MSTFQITRADGRSNGQVLIDYVSDGEAGQVYEYGELCNVLSEGTDRVFGVNDVRQVVATTQPRMLKEHQRTLHNVRRVGYRLALAKDHTMLAMARRHRADTQVKKGLQLLRHVRWDEMDENTRRAHQGHLMLAEALAANQCAFEKRMKSMENAIESLKQGATN